MTQKKTCRGELRDLPSLTCLPDLPISLTPLAFAQNSNNIKKKLT